MAGVDEREGARRPASNRSVADEGPPTNADTSAAAGAAASGAAEGAGPGLDVGAPWHPGEARPAGSGGRAEAVADPAGRRGAGRHRRPGTRWRTAAAAAALAAGVATLVGFAGPWVPLFDLAAAFRTQLVLLAAAASVAALVARRAGPALVAAVAVIANLAVIVPLYRDRPLPPTGRRLTIAHLNLQARQPDMAEVRRYLASGEADVLVVLDPPGTMFRAVRSVPAPYRPVYSDRGDIKALVVTRVPVRAVGRPTDPDFPEASVELTVETGTTPIHVAGLHARSPHTPSESAARDRNLAALARWRWAQRGPVVLLGDFNATPWSAPYGDLLARADVADAAQGFGPQPSWPAALGALGVPIDHALHTPDLGVADVHTGPAMGSYHRSLVVTYALP